MNQKHIDDLVRYRLDQADQSLLEAETLAQANLWHGVINRSYYAMFYAVLALTVVRGEVISRHTGVISFFDREFVKTGIFPKELSRLLHLGFERRQTNDYGEFSFIDQGEAELALSDAKTFIQTVKNYLLPK